MRDTAEHALHLIKPGLRKLPPMTPGLVDATMHRLQWNENPFDFPAQLKAEVLQRLAQAEWSRYPLGLRPWALIERLAKHHGVGADQVVVSNGASDLIKLILGAVLQPGDAFVLPSPTFLLYPLNARLNLANAVQVPLSPTNDWALPVDELLAAAHSYQAPVMAVCAPNNPTGTVYSAEDLRRLAAGCPGLLLLDEAYAEFGDQDLTELLPLGNVILLRTFSKLYAMAGVRVGYAITSPALAAEIQKVVTDFPLSLFSELAALVALDHHAAFLTQRDQIVAERERLAAALRPLPGVHVFSSGTNFLLVQLLKPRAAWTKTGPTA